MCHLIQFSAQFRSLWEVEVATVCWHKTVCDTQYKFSLSLTRIMRCKSRLCSKSCNADNDDHNEWNIQQIILVQFLPNICLEITSQDAGSDLQFVVRFVARMGESQCNCISLQLAMPCQWLDYHRTQTHQIFHISHGVWDEKCFSIYCIISLVNTAISCHQQIHTLDQQMYHNILAKGVAIKNFFKSDGSKDLTFKAKDLKIVLKDSLRPRPRTAITGFQVCFFKIITPNKDTDEEHSWLLVLPAH